MVSWSDGIWTAFLSSWCLFVMRPALGERKSGGRHESRWATDRWLCGPTERSSGWAAGEPLNSCNCSSVLTHIMGSVTQVCGGQSAFVGLRRSKLRLTKKRQEDEHLHHRVNTKKAYWGDAIHNIQAEPSTGLLFQQWLQSTSRKAFSDMHFSFSEEKHVIIHIQKDLCSMLTSLW